MNFAVSLRKKPRRRSHSSRANMVEQTAIIPDQPTVAFSNNNTTSLKSASTISKIEFPPPKSRSDRRSVSLSPSKVEGKAITQNDKDPRRASTFIEMKEAKLYSSVKILPFNIKRTKHIHAEQFEEVPKVCAPKRNLHFISN